ncbi:prepilin-type N-terminal cleavage/methylation domain-containing protein [Planctomycetota bacterium]
MKSKNAFTLIELLLVVLILGVLATIIIPRISQSTAGANSAACDTNVANLIRALEMRATANDGDYPASQTEFNSEILNDTATYFPHGAPTCPYSTTYTYDPTDKTVTYHSH